MTRRLAHRTRSDGGQIVVLAALMIPVFLLLGALVVDAGNWYTHKRSLQNRADAGALAAGLEYIQRNAAGVVNLRNCISDPGGTGTIIGNVAKSYAGTNESVGTTYNKNINTQADVTVRINAASPTDADSTDGGGPCANTGGAHSTGDRWSSKGMWTDVKIREANIGTLFGSFGISLPQIAAQARVKVEPIIGVAKKGLPFVNETGDQIECMWAQFVRARDIGAGAASPVTTGFTVSPSNPIPLTEGPNNTWTANVTNLQFTNANDDVAIRYWAGSKNGSAPCVFNPSGTQGPLPHALTDDRVPVAIDWINVSDDSKRPGADEAPNLLRFSLNADNCGGPGFLYTTDTSLTAPCRVGFQAVIDTGPANKVKGKITVDARTLNINASGSPIVRSDIAPVTVDYDTTGSNANPTTVYGTVTIYPNAVTGTTRTQNYTQTGASYLSASWTQTTGKIGSKNCPNAACGGTFQGESVSGVDSAVQQETYMADPLGSVPLISTSLSLPTRSFGAQTSTGPFSITVKHTAVDPDHVVLIRDSVQSSGNRTRAIYCGNSPGQGAAALENAIRDGCAKKLVLNQRSDSCSPAPLPSADPWDCVQIEQGNKTSISKGVVDRFACTTNNWAASRALGKVPGDGDERWAYIILTGYGRTFSASNNDWLPVEGLLRVYVTGWDGGSACSENDLPPRGYDDKGAQLWGHLVEPITLDPAVIVSDGECNLNNVNIQCSPRLVR